MKVDVRKDTVQVLNPLLSSQEARKAVPQFSQQSAAEEVGMLFSQRVESSSKALSQRNLRATDAQTQVQKVEGIRQLNDLYEQLGHPGQLGLTQMARQIRLELLLNPSVERLLDLTGGDPARTHVVLQFVTAQAQAEVRKDDAERSSRFQQQVRERYAPQIQAGTNIALALMTAGGDPALRQALRALYYNSVVMRQSLTTLMQALLGLLDEEGLSSGLSMMSRALADDIAAHRPSVPTHKLRTLLIGLQSCSQLGSILHSCRLFIQQLPAREIQLEQTAVSLLQRLLTYANAGIDLDDTQLLGQEFGGDNLSSQLAALNRVYALIQRLPLAVWSDQKSRQETLQLFLSLMGKRTQDEGIVHPTLGLLRPAR